MANHPQTKIKDNDGKFRSIDQDLAPIIKKLWQLKIKTLACCQGSCGGWCRSKHKWILIKKKHWKANYCKDRCYLLFATTKGYEKFLNYLNNNSDKFERFRSRIHGYDDKEYRKDNWTSNVFLTDYSELKEEFSVKIMLTFPHQHIKYIEELLSIS